MTRAGSFVFGLTGIHAEADGEEGCANGNKSWVIEAQYHKNNRQYQKGITRRSNLFHLGSLVDVMYDNNRVSLNSSLNEWLIADT